MITRKDIVKNTVELSTITATFQKKKLREKNSKMKSTSKYFIANTTRNTDLVSQATISF